MDLVGRSRSVKRSLELTCRTLNVQTGDVVYLFQTVIHVDRNDVITSGVALEVVPAEISTVHDHPQ